jgi:ATP-dependent Clp protease adaptor protein ClpS
VPSDREPAAFLNHAMTDTGTTILKEARTEVLHASPWQVVLHDDPVNYMAFVTLVLQKVFGYPKARAERHMLEVHRLGRSVVWTGEREKAEHYVHQLQSYHLTCTMERVEDGS